MPRAKRPVIKFKGILATPIERHTPSLTVTDLVTWRKGEVARVNRELTARLYALFDHYNIDHRKGVTSQALVLLILNMASDFPIPGFKFVDDSLLTEGVRPGGRHRVLTTKWTERRKDHLVWFTNVIKLTAGNLSGKKLSDLDACTEYAMLCEDERLALPTKKDQLDKRARTLKNVLLEHRKKVGSNF